MNYQLELDKIIEKLETRPKLLLHSCCGPCSSYVITYLNNYFDITVFYFNQSIYPTDEYDHRKAVQLSLIKQINEKAEHKVEFLDCDYNHESFLDLVKGHESDPECGARCHICYRQRLEATAKAAREGGFDFFCSTLSVSPYKSAPTLNEIGRELEAVYNVSWLLSDFKKREGYKQSIELSKVYNLYRQDYCGCEFSKNEQF